MFHSFEILLESTTTQVVTFKKLCNSAAIFPPSWQVLGLIPSWFHLLRRSLPGAVQAPGVLVLNFLPQLQRFSNLTPSIILPFNLICLPARPTACSPCDHSWRVATERVESVEQVSPLWEVQLGFRSDQVGLRWSWTILPCTGRFMDVIGCSWSIAVAYKSMTKAESLGM